MNGLIGFLMLVTPALLALLWIIFDFIKCNGIAHLFTVMAIVIYVTIAANLLIDELFK